MESLGTCLATFSVLQVPQRVHLCPEKKAAMLLPSALSRGQTALDVVSALCQHVILYTDAFLSLRFSCLSYLLPEILLKVTGGASACHPQKKLYCKIYHELQRGSDRVPVSEHVYMRFRTVVFKDGAIRSISDYFVVFIFATFVTPTIWPAVSYYGKAYIQEIPV